MGGWTEFFWGPRDKNIEQQLDERRAAAGVTWDEKEYTWAKTQGGVKMLWAESGKWVPDMRSRFAAIRQGARAAKDGLKNTARGIMDSAKESYGQRAELEKRKALQDAQARVRAYQRVQNGKTIDVGAHTRNKHRH